MLKSGIHAPADVGLVPSATVPPAGSGESSLGRLPQAAPATDRALARRISFLYLAVYLHYGIATPFLPLWFAKVGLTISQIGVIMALPLALRVLVAAPAANLADRLRRVREVLFCCVALTAVLMAGLSAFHTYSALLGVFTLVALCWDPIPVLADGYAVAGVRARGLDFGRMRVWGSFAFIGGSLGAGWAVDRMGTGAIPWLIAGALLLPLIAIPALPSERTFGDDVRAGKGEWRFILADRTLVRVMIGGGLIIASHALIDSCGAIDWTRHGYSARAVGFLTGLAIAAEVVALWFAQRVLGRRSPALLVLAAGVTAALRWVAMVADPGLGALVGLQLLQAVTSAAAIVGVMLTIGARVPGHLISTAQGLYAVMAGLAIAGGTAAAGVLWAHFGPEAYFVMAAAAALGALLVFPPVWTRQSNPA